MTRTAALVQAIREELERRRTNDIDGDIGLRSVTLVISFDQKTGAPREILFRKESRAGIRQVSISRSNKVPGSQLVESETPSPNVIPPPTY